MARQAARSQSSHQDRVLGSPGAPHFWLFNTKETRRRLLPGVGLEHVARLIQHAASGDRTLHSWDSAESGLLSSTRFVVIARRSSQAPCIRPAFRPSFAKRCISTTVKTAPAARVVATRTTRAHACQLSLAIRPKTNATSATALTAIKSAKVVLSTPRLVVFSPLHMRLSPLLPPSPITRCVSGENAGKSLVKISCVKHNRFTTHCRYAHAARACHEQWRECFRLDDSVGMTEWLAGIFL
jgi:hypothetical protein